MREFGFVLKWLASALISLGALTACSAAPTPVAVATSTLVPSTATDTPSPLAPSSTPRPSVTAVVTSTPSISTLLEISISPDADLTGQIIAALATELMIPTNRIQLVTIQARSFSAMTLDCIPTTGDALIAPPPRPMVQGYRYVLLLGAQLYEYHSNGTSAFQRCPFTMPLADDLLILVDPIAADTFRLVQDRLASELDISSRRILLVSMQSVIWRDTSLGCPLADQSYHPADIVGYRIVVTAGEQSYIYHSDSTNVYPCAAENEVLPN